MLEDEKGRPIGPGAPANGKPLVMPEDLVLRIPKRCLIHPNGDVYELYRPQTLREVSAMIASDDVDVVSLRHRPELATRHQVMLTDGIALMRPKKEQMARGINPIATALYLLQCRPNTFTPILGAVVITLDGDYAVPDVPGTPQ